MKEPPSVAEIVFLWGEQWGSRCLNVGMSELRVEAIILPHVTQHGGEISKEKAGSCSPLGVLGRYEERALRTPGHRSCAGAGSSHGPGAQLSQMHCRGLSREEAGRRLITSGPLAGAGGETGKTMLTHLPQQGQFSKSKLT